MKVRYIAFLIFYILLMGCKINKQVDEHVNHLPALDFLEQKITSWIDSGYYDGVSVRIIKNGAIFFENNYGGYTDTTALHVASAGKWVAAATIASVVDEGKLSWVDKVNKFLPEFTDIKGEATLRRLMSHTAGCPDYQPKDKRRDDYQTLEEAVANIVNLPVDTLPGTKFRYGGLAMQIAGRMAEIATGKGWETMKDANEWEDAYVKDSISIYGYTVLIEKIRRAADKKKPKFDEYINIANTSYISKYPNHPYSKEIQTIFNTHNKIRRSRVM